MTMPVFSIDEAATSYEAFGSRVDNGWDIVLVNRRMIPIYRAIRFGFARSFLMLTVLSPLMIE